MRTGWMHANAGGTEDAPFAPRTLASAVQLAEDDARTVAAVVAGLDAGLALHAEDTTNPHGVTAAQVGAAAASHGHALTGTGITGVLPVAKGGTGASDEAGARTALLALLGVGRLLWEGSWSDGSITVTGSSAYTVFALYASGANRILCADVYGEIAGIGNRAGGTNTAASTKYTSHFRATREGDVWTMTLSRALSHTGSSPYHAGVDYAVARIYGVI